MNFIYNLPIIRDIDFELLDIRMNEIDFKGQDLCERVYKYTIIISFVIALIYSYSTQQMSNGVYIIFAGTLLSFILCVPSWPCYNKNPVKWLPYVKPAKNSEVEQSS